MKTVSPPKSARFLLKKIIAESICDEVLGDMDELFERRVNEKGAFKAKMHYYKDTFLSIRNFKLRRKYQRQTPFTMYKNYLKIAYRNILKHKFHTFANILSLSIGLASVMLITLFVQQELSYDNFHTKGDRIHRLNKAVKRDGNITKNAESSGFFGPNMATEFPEVSQAVRVSQRNRATLTNKETNIKVNNLIYVDSNFFNVFDFELKRGNKNDVLVAPSSIVLTEKIATALFGNEDAVGKTILGMQGFTYTVTGIAADVPKNSHVQFDVLCSWETTVPNRGPLAISWMNNWYTQGLATYLLLEPGSQAKFVDEKLAAFEEKNIPERAEMYDFYLQPFEDVYLGSADVQFSPAMTGTKFLYILSSVAFAILLIAIFNYVNISTSKAANRSKEIGVRKVVGARKPQIIIQHLTESLLMVLIAAIISLFLLNAALPAFNAFTARALSMADISTSIILLFTGIVLFISFVSGIYPALIMSGFRAVQVLKGGGTGKAFGNTPRQVLITIQFIITIIMIASTIFISRQTAYMANKELGYDKENVLLTEFSDAIYENYEPFINDLISHNAITDYTLSQQTPRHSNWSNGVFPEGIQEKEIEARMFLVDDRFIDFYKIEIVEGRNFDRSVSSDQNGVIINEAMQALLDWENPVGRQVSMDEDGPMLTILGVVADFNFRSLHGTVQPMIMQPTARPYSLSIKTTNSNVADVISALEESWAKFEEREPLVYSFLEEDLAAFYESENNVFRAIMIFAVISIVISCFGLYGLTSYTVQRKFKEIGIRKVLGANEQAVIFLINKRFIITLTIALFVALPVSYYMMDQWLQGFAYRVSLGAGPFIVAIVVTLVITALTISLQTIKAARANPVKALRME